MGFRFRKSVNFGPLRINASKSGVGWSAGVLGFRYTKKSNGGTRTTVSAPGTGMSYVKETGARKGRTVNTGGASRASGGAPAMPPQKPKKEYPAMLHRVCGVIAIAFAFFIVMLAMIVILAAPITCVMFTAFSVVLLVAGIYNIEVAARKQGKQCSKRWRTIVISAFVAVCFLFGALGLTANVDNDANSSLPVSSEVKHEPTSEPTIEPTPEPTPEPTTEPTPEPTEQPAAVADVKEEMVWIAGSGNGEKYHSRSTCSGMKNPVEISLSEAQARGYGPCGRCH